VRKAKVTKVTPSIDKTFKVPIDVIEDLKALIQDVHADVVLVRFPRQN
jgi:hypothetical protein